MRWFFWRVIVGRAFRTIDGVLCVRRWWLAPFRKIHVRQTQGELVFIHAKAYEHFKAALEGNQQEWEALVHGRWDDAST